MCGIAGILALTDERADAEQPLNRMSHRMRFRGPDGEGVWFSRDRRVALAHRRLAIIDLSPSGAQPMALPDGAAVITFNGEIYNYRELRAELEAEGVSFRSHSDTEVLLHLYRRDGDRMCDRLRGMFAFAIWDDERKGLFLARDPLGIKPLYFSSEGGNFLFASQIKALMASGLVPDAPNPAGHVSFFLWGHCLAGRTLYRSVEELPAGCTLWVNDRSCPVPKKYFDLSSTIESPCCRENSPRDLREALMDSVRSHLVADVPVSIFLSAGKDSATIVGLASEVIGGNAHAVTLAFSEFAETTNDEAPLAKIVAGQYGARHEVCRVSGKTFHDDLPRILEAMDTPSIDGVNTYYVSKAASELGIKVALSGLGGDELFGGYPSFRQVPKLASGLKPLSGSPTLGRAVRKAARPWIGSFTSPKVAGLLEYGGCLPGAFLLRRGLFMPWELDKLLDPDMVKEGLESLQSMKAMQQTIDPITTDFGRVMALEMSVYMRDRLLKDSDWASMAHSLELRTPLVDRELLTFVACHRLGHRNFTKNDMTSTVARPLPGEVLNRQKTGFTVPVAEWLLGRRPGSRQEASLREWAKIVYRSFVPA
jgi:asparagine synthase (glutamine-hydrolysing)